MKPQKSLINAIVYFSLCHMLIVQWPLIKQVLRMVDITTLNGAYALVVVEIIQLCLFVAVLGVVSIVSVTAMRIVAGALLIADVVALYFMVAFGILLNQEMIANILNTDSGEVSALIDWKLFAFVLWKKRDL